jgi:hypothetical protein
MRKVGNVVLGLVVALALVGVTSSTARAQGMEKKGKEVSLTGAQVIDLHCYTAGGLKGDAHKECAVACAKVGVPLGLLSQDGKIYVPVASGPMNNQAKLTEKLQPYAEGLVNVKGTLFERNGLLGIEIESVEPVKS